MLTLKQVFGCRNTGVHEFDLSGPQTTVVIPRPAHYLHSSPLRVGHNLGVSVLNR